MKRFEPRHRALLPMYVVAHTAARWRAILGEMDDPSIAAMRAAIEGEHGGCATLIDCMNVMVRAASDRWSGTVCVFSLVDHPHTETAFAWKEGDVICTAIRTDAVALPSDAVRASLKQKVAH